MNKENTNSIVISKKKLIAVTAFMGFVIGIFICYSILLIISLINNTGEFLPAEKTLVEQFGSENSAVLFQYVLSGIMGIGFALSSFIWESQKLNLALQTILHFIVISGLMFPVAYFCKWMPSNPVGIAVYFGVFAAIYLVIWIIRFLSLKAKIKKVKSKIES